MATAHGAGLMLVPFMQGLCAAPAAIAPGHAAVMHFLTCANVNTALLVAMVHTLASMLAGISMAWLIYRYVGLRFLRHAWLNLDAL